MGKIEVNEALSYLIKEANSPFKTLEQRTEYDYYLAVLTPEEKEELEAHILNYLNAYSTINQYISLQQPLLPGTNLNDYRTVQDNAESRINQLWEVVLDRLRQKET